MLIPLAFMLAGHVGDSDPPDAALATRPRPAAIVGGTPAVDASWDAVVALRLPSDKLCSGVIVAPRLVLTAAHCVAGVANDREVHVVKGDDAAGPSQRATSWGYDTDRYCPSCEDDRFDVGWVEVASAFDLDSGFIRPIATQEEWDEVIRPGTSVTVAGFGATAGDRASDGIKRVVDVEITHLSDAGTELFAGGDGRDSCDGDSGGPVFARLADGTRRIAGLTSRGDEDCGGGGIYATPYATLCSLREATGVDLTAPGCEECDCITSDPNPDAGCAVAGGDRWTRLVLVPLLAMVGRRKRRC